MRRINLANTTVLDQLESFSDWFFNDYDYESLHQMMYVQESPPAEKTATDEYLRTINPDEHDGFPPSIRGHELAEFSGKQKYNADMVRRVDQIIYGLERELCVRRNALAMYYPPGGYIGWHTNWNAAGYNVLFTYSLTGDGEFKYLDQDTQTIVRIPDEAGKWTAKVGYYGTKKEPHRVCWHAATTNSPRLTFAYLLPDNDMWEMMVEDLEDPV